MTARTARNGGSVEDAPLSPRSRQNPRFVSRPAGKDASLAAAREAVGEREVIELTAEGSRLFVDALVDPPEPNENLRALLARRSEGTPDR